MLAPALQGETIAQTKKSLATNRKTEEQDN